LPRLREDARAQKSDAEDSALDPVEFERLEDNVKYSISLRWTIEDLRQQVKRYAFQAKRANVDKDALNEQVRKMNGLETHNRVVRFILALCSGLTALGTLLIGLKADDPLNNAGITFYFASAFVGGLTSAFDFSKSKSRDKPIRDDAASQTSAEED
jgi:hypothetical protein